MFMNPRLWKSAPSTQYIYQCQFFRWFASFSGRNCGQVWGWTWRDLIKTPIDELPVYLKELDDDKGAQLLYLKMSKPLSSIDAHW